MPKLQFWEEKILFKYFYYYYYLHFWGLPEGSKNQWVYKLLFKMSWKRQKKVVRNAKEDWSCEERFTNTLVEKIYILIAGMNVEIEDVKWDDLRKWKCDLWFYPSIPLTYTSIWCLAWVSSHQFLLDYCLID